MSSRRNNEFDSKFQFHTNLENQNMNPNHIYLNLSINNNTGSSIPCSFIETRSQPFLNKPDDYECSVIRFNISSNNSLPLFHFIPQPGAQYPQWNNLTTYVTGQMVYYQGGIYEANSNNTGFQPDISPVQWTLTTLNPSNRNIPRICSI